MVMRTMELYFSPLACSLATRIALYEAEADATFIGVDAESHTTYDGRDYAQIHGLALVPALRLDDGELLTENAAILQHVAEQFPAARLAPTDARGLTHLRQWLSFISTELHKGVFNPVFDATAPADAKAHALSKAQSRLSWVAARLEGREFLLDRFSVADAYLYTVLNWTFVTPVDLKRWPVLAAYRARLHERPSIARAFAQEQALYAEERARHAKT
jgi:glutathione S-transferase